MKSFLGTSFFGFLFFFTISILPVSAADGVCGSAANRAVPPVLSSAPPTDLCLGGTWSGWGDTREARSLDFPVFFDASGNHIARPDGGRLLGWAWRCVGSAGGRNAGCFGYTPPGCGTANGGSFLTPPADPAAPPSSGVIQDTLCRTGRPTSVVTNPGTYNWQCDNENHVSVACSATRLAAPAPTVEITARGPVASAPEGFWKKFFSFITGGNTVAKASGPDARITVGEKAEIAWTATGVSLCSVTKVETGDAVSSTFSGSRVLTGLTAGTHTYKMDCFGATGSASDTVKVIVDVPCGGCGFGGPGTPGPSTGGSFTATPGACSTYRIDVAWSAVAGATSYQLRAGGTQIYSGASPSYPHTGLPASSSVDYDVRATNSSGSSAWSSTIRGTAPPVCAATCGDGTCNSGELCSTCAGDCGACGGPTFDILAAAGTGGSIAPNGLTAVPSGTNQTYTISALAGYSILAVRVDGINVGAVSSYTFNNVTANHVIDADFFGGPLPVCGDGACNGGELCSTCSADCGSCAAASLRICPVSSTLFSGSTQPFKAWYNPAGTPFNGCLAPNGTDTTAAATWTSFDPSKVSVLSPGLVRGNALGSTVIRAAWGVYSESAAVNVVSPPCSPNTCGDYPTDSGKVCTGSTYAISDGCSGILTCPGTRDCDYNWKEISPY